MAANVTLPPGFQLDEPEEQNNGLPPGFTLDAAPAAKPRYNSGISRAAGSGPIMPRENVNVPDPNQQPEHINQRIGVIRAYYETAEPNFIERLIGGDGSYSGDRADDDVVFQPYVSEEHEKKLLEGLTDQQRQARTTLISTATTLPGYDPANPGQTYAALGRRALQGATLNLADDIGAGVEAAVTDKTWDETQKEWEDQVKSDKDITGKGGDLVELAGSFVGPGGVYASGAKKIAGAGAKWGSKAIKRGVAPGGAMGGAQMYGVQEDGKDVLPVVAGVGVGASAGAGAYAIPGAAKATGRVVGRAARTAKEWTDWMHARRTPGVAPKISKGTQKAAVRDVVDHLEKHYPDVNALDKAERANALPDTDMVPASAFGAPGQKLAIDASSKAGSPNVGPRNVLAEAEANDLFPTINGETLHQADHLKNRISDSVGIPRGRTLADARAAKEAAIDDASNNLNALVAAGGNTKVKGFADVVNNHSGAHRWYKGAEEAGSLPGATGPTKWPLPRPEFEKKIAPFRQIKRQIGQAKTAITRGAKTLKTREAALVKARVEWENAPNRTIKAQRRKVFDDRRRELQSHKKMMDEFDRALTDLERQLDDMGPPPVLLTDDNVPVYAWDLVRKVASGESAGDDYINKAMASHWLKRMESKMPQSGKAAKGIHQNLKDIGTARTDLEDFEAGAGFFTSSTSKKAGSEVDFRRLPDQRRQQTQREGSVYALNDMIDEAGRNRQNLDKILGSPDKLRRLDDRTGATFNPANRRGAGPVPGEVVARDLRKMSELRGFYDEVRKAMDASDDDIAAVLMGMGLDLTRRAQFSGGYALSHGVSSLGKLPSPMKAHAIMRIMLDKTYQGKELIRQEFLRRAQQQAAQGMRDNISLSRDAIASAIIRDAMTKMFTGSSNIGRLTQE